MVFQVMGFDFNIDHKCEPSLFNINMYPSFSTNNVVDIKAKRGIIIDVLKKLLLSMPRKNEYRK